MVVIFSRTSDGLNGKIIQSITLNASSDPVLPTVDGTVAQVFFDGDNYFKDGELYVQVFTNDPSNGLNARLEVITEAIADTRFIQGPTISY